MDSENEHDDDPTDSEYVPDKEDIIEQEKTCDDDEEKKKGAHRRTSPLWNHFTVLTADIATCNLCGRQLSYRATSANLRKHLQARHPGTTGYTKPVKGPAQGARMPPKPPYKPKYSRQRRFRSATWKYFKVLEDEDRMAKCKLCAQSFSFSCISNLKKHLQRKHEGVPYDVSSDDEVELEKGGDNSPVWAYFKCLDQALQIASCLICKKRIDYNDNNDLIKHVAKKHPRVDLGESTNSLKRLMITESGDIYEIDDDIVKMEPKTKQENDEGDSDDEWSYQNESDALHGTSEYLDEKIFDMPQPTPTPSPPKRKRIHPSISPPQTPQEDTTLDIFGKYMISLLKKLPKHKSDQLQVDFIRQIMEAQNGGPKTKQIQNTRYSSRVFNIDDNRVSSNSEPQRVITTSSNGDIRLTGNEHIIVANIVEDVSNK